MKVIGAFLQSVKIESVFASVSSVRLFFLCRSGCWSLWSRANKSPPLTVGRAWHGACIDVAFFISMERTRCWQWSSPRCEEHAVSQSFDVGGEARGDRPFAHFYLSLVDPLFFFFLLRLYYLRPQPPPNPNGGTFYSIFRERALNFTVNSFLFFPIRNK